MANYQYLIIGGGMTAAAAVDGIREVDSTGGIGLISAEPDLPYNRPPLESALEGRALGNHLAQDGEQTGGDLPWPCCQRDCCRAET